MLKNSLLVAALASAFAMPAMAEEAKSAHTVTSNVGFVSNYVYRGITQTVGKPAIQGGIDYSHASGIYAGVWGSNVSWITGSGATGDASMELDTYAGYRSTIVEDVPFDVGFIGYNYLGNYIPAAGGYDKADTKEAYGSVGYKWVTVKYSYAFGSFLTVPGATGTNYIEVNASYPIADSGFTLAAHYGKQKYKGTFTNTLVAGVSADGVSTDPSYSDYKLAVTKDVSGYVLGLAYTNTNAKANGYYTYTSTSGRKSNWAKNAIAVSLTHSF